MSRVGPESARLAEGLDTLGRQLLRVAEVFEREDNTAAGNLAGMPWVDWGSGGGVAATDGRGRPAGLASLLLPDNPLPPECGERRQKRRRF